MSFPLFSEEPFAFSSFVLELTIGLDVSGFSSGLAPHPVNAQIHNPTATNLLMFVFFILYSTFLIRYATIVKANHSKNPVKKQENHHHFLEDFYRLFCYTVYN
jgi:hypothetical protein